MKNNHAGHHLTISAHSDARGIRAAALLCADCRKVLHEVKFCSDSPSYYVASPLNAPTQDGIRANMMMARKYEQDISTIAEPDAIVSAPHAWIPELMNDNEKSQRKAVLLYGLTVMKGCDALVVCGCRITAGMLGEITAAQAAGIPILCLSYKDGKPFLMTKETKATG